MTDAAGESTRPVQVGNTLFLTCPSCLRTAVLMNQPLPSVHICPKPECGARWRLTRTKLGILWEAIGAVLPYPGGVS
jgi:hypothetical protein